MIIWYIHIIIYINYCNNCNYNNSSCCNCNYITNITNSKQIGQFGIISQEDTITTSKNSFELRLLNDHSNSKNGTGHPNITESHSLSNLNNSNTMSLTSMKNSNEMSKSEVIIKFAIPIVGFAIWLLMFVLIQQLIDNFSTNTVKNNYYLISYLFVISMIIMKRLSRIIGRKIDAKRIELILVVLIQ